MRFRGLSVLTNTPPRTSQRSPGGMQQNAIMEPVLAKAARQLGIDQVALHRINAPAGKAPLGGPGKDGKRSYVTSAFVREAIDRGVELFNWDERKPRSGKRVGAKARGVGIAVSPFIGGYSINYDGLMTIRPDGKLYVQSGVGNLGTHSVIDTARVAGRGAGRAVGERRGRLGRHEQESAVDVHVGRQPDRPRRVAIESRRGDGRQAQAAGDRRENARRARLRSTGWRTDTCRGPGGGMTLAQAAQRAIALGGKYDGHELPADIHAMTRASATALAGLGLMGVAKDTYPHDGETHSYVVGFAEVEVDVETGVVKLVDYTAVGDVGTVVNPRSLGGQILGGGCLGHRPRAHAADGVRPALRRAARHALSSHQAADHHGCPGRR